MDLFVNKLVSSAVQIILFALIPFIWWIIRGRKQNNFFTWVGIKVVEDKNKKQSIMYSILIMVLFSALSIFILFSLKGIETATSLFKGLGISALPAVLVYAIFNTSFPEELFFRGFLLKRLSNKFGFKVGNLVQSILFGIIHGMMFFQLVGGLKAMLIILFTGGIGYAMGVINEKKSNGSILPSWIIHAISNIFSSLISMFSLI